MFAKSCRTRSRMSPAAVPLLRRRDHGSRTRSLPRLRAPPRTQRRHQKATLHLLRLPRTRGMQTLLPRTHLRGRDAPTPPLLTDRHNQDRVAPERTRRLLRRDARRGRHAHHATAAARSRATRHAAIKLRGQAPRQHRREHMARAPRRVAARSRRERNDHPHHDIQHPARRVFAPGKKGR